MPLGAIPVGNPHHIHEAVVHAAPAAKSVFGSFFAFVRSIFNR